MVGVCDSSRPLAGSLKAEGSAKLAAELRAAQAAVRAEKAESEVARLASDLADSVARHSETAELLQRVSEANAELRRKLDRSERIVGQQKEEIQEARRLESLARRKDLGLRNASKLSAAPPTEYGDADEQNWKTLRATSRTGSAGGAGRGCGAEKCGTCSAAYGERCFECGGKLGGGEAEGGGVPRPWNPRRSEKVEAEMLRLDVTELSHLRHRVWELERQLQDGRRRGGEAAAKEEEEAAKLLAADPAEDAEALLRWQQEVERQIARRKEIITTRANKSMEVQSEVIKLIQEYDVVFQEGGEEDEESAQDMTASMSYRYLKSSPVSRQASSMPSPSRGPTREASRATSRRPTPGGPLLREAAARAVRMATGSESDAS